MIRPLPAGIEIRWLEDVEHLDYVRMSTVLARNRRRPIRAPVTDRTGRRLGYEVLPPEAESSNGYFIRRVFWVKHYDRGQRNDTGIYATSAPAEAVEAVDPNWMADE